MPTLTDTQIRNAKPAERPVRLYDDRGLYLEVSPKGGKWWRLKYSFDGKARLLSLGTYPDTGLKAVRDKRDQARRLVAQGVDPSAARKAEKASRSETVVNSFEAVAREWHATIHLGQVSVGHAARTLIRLEQDVFPWLGGLPVGEIKAPQLLQAMRRIEARGAIERAGPAKLNSPMRVDTAPEGEDIARENWSKHEQKTPPHALSGIQGQGGAGRRSRRQDAGRVGAAA